LLDTWFCVGLPGWQASSNPVNRKINNGFMGAR